jgi:hypothetical protein
VKLLCIYLFTNCFCRYMHPIIITNTSFHKKQVANFENRTDTCQDIAWHSMSVDDALNNMSCSVEGTHPNFCSARSTLITWKRWYSKKMQPKWVILRYCAN